jgi:hypothetical protein
MVRVFPIDDRGVVHVNRREIDQMLNRIHKITKHGTSPRVWERERESEREREREREEEREMGKGLHLPLWGKVFLSH